MKTISSCATTCTDLPAINDCRATVGTSSEQTYNPAVLDVLVNGASSKSITSTTVLPAINDPSLIGPVADAAEVQPTGSGLSSLPQVEFGKGNAQRQVEAQQAPGAPQPSPVQATLAQRELLESMASNRKTPPPTCAKVDPLEFYNGLLFEQVDEESVREYVVHHAKEEAHTNEFVNAPYVDPTKVQVKFTEYAWSLFRVFGSDFAYHMVDERAYELATGLVFNDKGLKRLADSYYGPMCGHNPDGAAVKVYLGEMWWKSARSKDIRNISEVVVEPTKDSDDHTSRVFNRFHILRRGAVRPNLSATRADIKVFDDHLILSAGGCEVTREYVLDWLAWVYQNPGSKPATALAFVSPEEGTGKSWFLYPLKWIYGPDLVGSTGGDALFEKFDDPFINKWMTHVDEIPDPAKVRLSTDPITKLNRIITSPYTSLRPLGLKASEMRTPVIVIACNKVEHLTAVLGGRRLCIIYNPGVVMNAAYFDGLFAYSGTHEAPGWGMADLAGYLATRDVSKWNPNAAPPVTAGRVIANAASLSKEAKFLRMLFEEDHPLFAKDFCRVLDMAAQIDTACPAGMRKGLNLSADNLPKVFKELGWKRIGVDGSYRTTNKTHRAWCWRNFDKWGSEATSPKERFAHAAGGSALTLHNGGKP